MAIVAPENTRAGADIPAERLSARQGALREPHMPFLMDDKPWVGCYYPTDRGGAGRRPAPPPPSRTSSTAPC